MSINFNRLFGVKQRFRVLYKFFYVQTFRAKLLMFRNGIILNPTPCVAISMQRLLMKV